MRFAIAGGCVLLMRCLSVLSGATLLFTSTVAAAAAQQGDLDAILRRFHELYAAGNYPAALVEAQKLEAGVKARFGVSNANYGIALYNLAEVYWRQGKYADAERLYKRTLAIYEKALGKDHTDVADTLNNLGLVYGDQGKYAEAQGVYKRALAIYEKARSANPASMANTLHNLAIVYIEQAKYAEAEGLYKHALAIKERALGTDNPDVAKTLSNLADVYVEQAKYAEAEGYYKRALAIKEKTLGTDHLAVAYSLIGLANVYFRQARYAAAEGLYKRALAIREKGLGMDHPDVARNLMSLAGVYVEQGKHADAEGLLRRALAIYEKAFGPDHPDVATALANLAVSFHKQGKDAEAEGFDKRALAIREKALGADHPDVANTLNNLAVIYVEEGKYTEAERFHKRALAIREKTLGADHWYVAHSLNNLALLYKNQGKYAEAEGLYKRALVIQEKTYGRDHPDVAQSLNDLAGLYQNENRYADALPLVQELIAQGRASTAVALPVLMGAQRNKLVSTETALDEGLDVAQRASQSSAAAAVNKLAVRLSAGSDRLSQLVRRDQDLAAEAEALDKAIIAVAKQAAQRDRATEQRIRDRLAAIAAERNDLQKAFAKEFPDYAALSNPPPLTGKEVQALLSADEALVLFSAGDKESYVLALTRDGFDWKTISLGAQALAEKVAAFRRGLDVEVLLHGGWSGLFDLGLSHGLYDALIGPIEPLIRDKRHLMVVPTGALTALPFHLLVTEKPAVAVPQVKTARDLAAYRDAAWLLKRHAVSVLPSVASLKALRVFAHKEQGGKPLVGFGDPIFNPVEEGRIAALARNMVVTRSYPEFWKGADIDRSMLRSLPRLPETADELRAVAKKLGAPESSIHLRQDASETTVKRTALSDYRVVYFATHGLVAGDIKGLAEPSLALTLPKEPSELDDGLLTASEVAQLKLNADWVVLSACNTIAGEKPGAEALSGLARAFFYAGARALLVSHWAVESNAAMRLTTSTFDIMKSDPKLGRAEALRRAMLAYMNDTTNPQYAYPALWAPFVVVGEGAAR